MKKHFSSTTSGVYIGRLKAMTWLMVSVRMQCKSTSHKYCWQLCTVLVNTTTSSILTYNVGQNTNWWHVLPENQSFLKVDLTSTKVSLYWLKVGDKACSTSMMKGKRVQELLMLHAFIAGNQRYSVKKMQQILQLVRNLRCYTEKTYKKTKQHMT